MTEQKKHRKGYKGRWTNREIADGMMLGSMHKTPSMNAARALRLCLERRNKGCYFQKLSADCVIVTCTGIKLEG